MELTDAAQLSTQLHPPAGCLQTRSQGLTVEDGAAGDARPARPRRANRGRRISWLQSCNHSDDEGSPSGGSSSARPRRASNVGAGRVLGISGVTWGDQASPLKGGPRVGL